MSLAWRGRMRPVLYPLGIVVAFVFYQLVRTGVSPYAAGRPLLLAVALGIALPWLLGFVVGDRDRAGVLALVVVMFVLAGQQPMAALLLVCVFLILFLVSRTGMRDPGRIRWPLITRAMSTVTAVILVAVGIAAVQDGRTVQMAHDLVAEAPVGRHAPPAIAGVRAAPSVYLLLLDGYPRADKLLGEFGIDNAPFVGALRERAFAVADHSRANYTVTDLTLASVFSGGALGALDAGTAEYRRPINEGSVLQAFRGQGYEVVSISAGFEGVALRQADRFIDSGQLNEFEWNLLKLSGLAPIIDLVQPTLLADQHRARVLATFEALSALAGERAGRPRLVFAHLPIPHSPQVFGPAGEPQDVQGLRMPFIDRDEYVVLGPEEYGRRLAGQISYVNRRVLGAVDAIVERDPRAVIVVFSDHGSGIREFTDIGGSSDVDLRTANLLAVRSPGAAGIIEDRSTLVNLLPRILRAYAGSGPSDVPEAIFGRTVDGRATVYRRPD